MDKVTVISWVSVSLMALILGTWALHYLEVTHLFYWLIFMPALALGLSSGIFFGVFDKKEPIHGIGICFLVFVLFGILFIVADYFTIGSMRSCESKEGSWWGFNNGERNLHGWCFTKVNNMIIGSNEIHTGGKQND